MSCKCQRCIEAFGEQGNLFVEKKMKEYTVSYSIVVDAENPEDAALQVEQIFNDMSFRPYFNVKDNDGNSVDVDLESEIVKE